jgi:hypothetical protein
VIAEPRRKHGRVGEDDDLARAGEQPGGAKRDALDLPVNAVNLDPVADAKGLSQKMTMPAMRLAMVSCAAKLTARPTMETPVSSAVIWMPTWLAAMTTPKPITDHLIKRRIKIADRIIHVRGFHRRDRESAQPAIDQPEDQQEHRRDDQPRDERASQYRTSRIVSIQKSGFCTSSSVTFFVPSKIW